MLRRHRNAFLSACILSISPPLAGEGRGQEVTPTVAPDSLSLEELEAKLLGELGAVDSVPRPDTLAPAPAPIVVASQPATLLPDISVIADILTDLSPEESTLEEGDRFQLREVELAFQGSVDPYFRYDAFLAVHAGEIEIEEGYVTTLALPAGLQVKAGQFRLPFGKVNLTHRPEINTIDYPLYLQSYFGEEGLSSTGIWASWIGDPLGFFQEISLTATNGAEEHAPEEEEGGQELEEEGKDLFDDLADRPWIAHLKNSFDLTPASNLEIGGSWTTSATDDPERIRTTLYGVDAIWRWKPLAQAKYRSAILQTEVAWRNEAGPAEERFGAFVFGQYQLTQRVYAGARYDYLEPAEAEEETIQAGQAILRYFPTEFSQLRLAYERRSQGEGGDLDRVLFQMTFALGPHRPHPF